MRFRARQRSAPPRALIFKMPDGIVHLLNIHLASPHTAFKALATQPSRGVWKLRTNTVRRRNECAKISDYLSTLRGPVILAGMISNTRCEMPHLSAILVGTLRGGRLPPPFTGGTATRTTRHLPHSKCLDHILCGLEVTCTSCLSLASVRHAAQAHGCRIGTNPQNPGKKDSLPASLISMISAGQNRRSEIPVKPRPRLITSHVSNAR